MKGKFRLEGILTPRTDLNLLQEKEIAAKLNLPENDVNKRDLMFMSAILVSTGTNKNGAHFLGSELIKARRTIAQKPLNLEHQEQSIIGHITEWLFMDHSGKVLDDEEMYNSLAACKDDHKAMTAKLQKYDEMDMDIGIICAVYRDRFPEIAEDIELGRYKVSMECYYEGFDVKVGDFILPRSLAESASSMDITEKGIDLTLLPEIRAVASGKSLGNIMVSRVLRAIHFCGAGVVENPANVRSHILEAAKQLKQKAESIKSEERLVASIDIENLDHKDFREDTKVEIAENVCTLYGVIQDGKLMSTWDNVEEAKKSAAEVAFRTFKIGKREVFDGNPLSSLSSVRYDWGLEDSSSCSSGIYVIEVFGQFAPSDEVESCSYIYSVTDGVAESSVQLMKNTKICRVIEPSSPAKDSDEDQSETDSSEANDPIQTPAEEESKEEEKAQEIKTITAPPAFPSKKVYPIKVPKAPAQTSKKERAALKDDQFGLRKSRKFPIHTADRVTANMEFFPHIRKKLTEAEQKEFFTNLVKAGIRLGVDTLEFEEATRGLEFKDYSSTYGLPRLKKFPLDNRQQVISAMSRFTRLTLEVSDTEREGLYINILRAAHKMGINTEDFRKRVSSS
jgi:hypothetical protein